MMGREEAMVPITESAHELFADRCQRYGVRRLDLFGSAATEGLDPNRCGLDFVVEILPEQELGPWLHHYFVFRAELSRRFGRSVGLVMTNAVKSPYFQRELGRQCMQPKTRMVREDIRGGAGLISQVTHGQTLDAYCGDRPPKAAPT
jgi:predicted nucleotidyltransferase